MSKADKNYNYALRLPAAETKAIKEICRHSQTSFNQVVTLCIRKALPAVREALAIESGRVTNVDPLPDKVLKRLYAEEDEDSEAIALFIKAQSKIIEE